MIECHTNPSHGVLIEYNLNTINTIINYYTVTQINEKGNILFTVNPPHFSPIKYKTEIVVFVDFCELGIIPYDFYEIFLYDNNFLLQGINNNYIVQLDNNKWQIYNYLK